MDDELVVMHLRDNREYRRESSLGNRLSKVRHAMMMMTREDEFPFFLLLFFTDD
jgi:hypothetical protein